MNLYRLRALEPQLRRIAKKEDRAQVRLRFAGWLNALRTSKGSQAVHRARRERERLARESSNA